MLEARILATLRFFDLQDLPLTLFELHKFLLVDPELLPKEISEFTNPESINNSALVSIDSIMNSVGFLVSENKLEEFSGFYCLPGRKKIIQKRLDNYFFGIRREKLIKRYINFLAYIPFVRGVALAGSQALGQEKENSDIDLLIITEPGFMWTARTLVSLYFHLFGIRRHGSFAANRFCLNHYVAGEKVLTEGRNLYTASEYAKLRPLVYESSVFEFVRNNLFWIKNFFPNIQITKSDKVKQKKIQLFLEKFFKNNFGASLEKRLAQIQKKRIHTDEYVKVSEDELSFHPSSKEEKLLLDFFKNQQ